GTSPVDLFSLSLTMHLDFDRPYLPWVFLHYWDWTLFNGFPLMLAWYVGLWVWLRNRREAVPGLALALLITMVLLTVSGTGGGEAGRIRSLFPPFALPAAAGALRSSLDKAPSLVSWLSLPLPHSILMFVLFYSLIFFPTVLTPPPPPPPTATNMNAISA